MEISIPTPPHFSLRRTLASHGWSELLPFEFDQQSWTLLRVVTPGGDDDEAAPLTVTIYGQDGALMVRTRRKLGARATAQVVRDVRHMLRLDEDLSEFYAAVTSEPKFEWIVRAGAGRLLRSPTVYEDLVKSICTTNCSWALTKKMVEGLVRKLGREAEDGRRTFPTPQAMADAPLEFYREEVRAGYRASYLKELAERVASGELDVESWLTSELETDSLKREMKRVKGVGDYAAENLLKLVGRYDVLALDSWVRAKFSRTHNKGRTTPDAKIARHYSRFKSFRGLALWCDMTQDWLEDEMMKAEG
jgi:N-glycosylase/DNA lyase